jgi:hypothetical protein
MREVSRENKAVYSSTPRSVFIIGQRLTMVNLHQQFQSSRMVPQKRLLVNQFSSEIGTDVQRREILVATKNPFKNLIMDFDDSLDVTDPEEGATEWQGEWNVVKENLIRALFLKAFKNTVFSSPYEAAQENFSLFSPQDIQDLIRQRISQGSEASQFPVTFVRVKEVNLLDYTRDWAHEETKTIKELVKYIRESFYLDLHLPWQFNIAALWREIKFILIRFLGGDEQTSLDGLRKFLNFRYIHEVHVDLYKIEKVSYPLTGLEEAGEESASFNAAEGGGAKRRRE